MAASYTPISRTPITGLSTGSNLIDMTAYSITAGSTAVALLLHNTNSSNRYDVGTRKPGGASLPIGDIDADAWSTVVMPLDGTLTGELYIQNVNVEPYLIGEFDASNVFFDDYLDVTGQLTLGSDSVVDISGSTGADTAAGMFFVAQGPGGGGDGFDFNAGLNATQSPVRNIREQFQGAVGCDAERATFILDSGSLFVQGYNKSGITWAADKYTNDDQPVATTGTFEDVLTLSGGEEAVLWDHKTDDVNGTYGVQPKGEAPGNTYGDLYKMGFRNRAFSYEAPGTGDVVQAARTGGSANIRFYRVATVDAGTTAVPLDPNDSAHAHTADAPTVTPGAMLLAPENAGHAHSVDEPTVTPIVSLVVQLKVIDTNSDISNRTINWKAWTLSNYNANTAPDVTGQDVSTAGGVLTVQVTGSTGVAWHCEGKDAVNAQLFIGEFVSQ